MVFYLKYRPKKISELDSLDLREKLESTLKNKLPDKISHAFLFTGPKGLGKTSTARIIAKAINCTNRKPGEIEPCNICSSCKSITNGSNLDVLEIDAASNRGIDEIRDLREKIRLSPLNSKKKVYIIDEVHMLTTEAFNALLKTLEEPPSHAIFILCTTEPHKVPQTITSRCFHIKFSKATDENLLNSFHRILKGEGIKGDKDALLKIAKLSDGSFRDGAKILEELSTVSKNITQKLIQKKYKTQTIASSIDDLIISFVKKDVKEGIKIIENVSKEGADFKFFIEELINRLHEGLLTKAQGGSFELDIFDTRNLIEKLVKAHMEMRYSVLPQIPLELVIVEWCYGTEFKVQGSKFKDEIEENVGSLPDSAGSQSLNLRTKKPASTAGFGEAKHDKILLDLIEETKKDNFSIAGVLRGCKVEKYDKKELILSTGFKFHKERLSDKKIIDLLEKNLEKITRNKIKFFVQ